MDNQQQGINPQGEKKTLLDMIKELQALEKYRNYLNLQIIRERKRLGQTL